jgi:hypothetical protein
MQLPAALHLGFLMQAHLKTGMQQRGQQHCHQEQVCKSWSARGNTATPDGTWSNFTAISNGGDVGVNSRYLQYRADLSTTNTKYTQPALQDIAVECSEGADITPPVITNIVSKHLQPMV